MVAERPAEDEEAGRWRVIFRAASAALRVALLVATLAPCALVAAPAIEAGGSHSVALKADGTLLTWGDDSAGQLGLGRTLGSTTASRLNGLNGVSDIASGFSHVVA